MEKSKVTFYRKGKRVIAVDENGFVGIAKCHPTDKFDFRVGAEIAYNRMLEVSRICIGDTVSFTGTITDVYATGMVRVRTSQGYSHYVPKQYLRKERG